jgi:hypothetical protein
VNFARRPMTPKQQRRVATLERMLRDRIARLALRTANGRTLDGNGVAISREMTSLKWAIEKLGEIFVEVPEQMPSEELIAGARAELELVVCARRIVCAECRRSSNCALAPAHEGDCSPHFVRAVHCTEVTPP